MKITNCTLYFANLLSLTLHPATFIVVADKPRANGFYTASIWIGSSKGVVWSPNGCAENISSEDIHRTRMIIDDIEVRKSEGIYIELDDANLYTRECWEVIKVDNGTIFKPVFVE